MSEQPFGTEIEPLTDSILNSTKKMLGLGGGYDAFDADVIVNINSVFSKLYQLGVGPDDGFAIQGDTEVWTDFLGDDKRYGFVKNYVYLQVRLWFDPPQNSFLVEAVRKQLDELEWRINVLREEDLWKIQHPSLTF